MSLLLLKLALQLGAEACRVTVSETETRLTSFRAGTVQGYTVRPWATQGRSREDCALPGHMVPGVGGGV